VVGVAAGVAAGVPAAALAGVAGVAGRVGVAAATGVIAAGAPAAPDSGVVAAGAGNADVAVVGPTCEVVEGASLGSDAHPAAANSSVMTSTLRQIRLLFDSKFLTAVLLRNDSSHCVTSAICETRQNLQRYSAMSSAMRKSVSASHTEFVAFRADVLRSALVKQKSLPVKSRQAIKTAQIAASM
jgi:hypothetical protein